MCKQCMGSNQNNKCIIIQKTGAVTFCYSIFHLMLLIKDE